ncbi:MAG TPA: hypothetical protein VGS97_10510 [Actinocrinis sp.]|uniref:hypothetical protein n=1 Tax=Actinocrinis sp. TaxID=1920516 RepID=UPI002DDDADAF|nr:hypothetical protein [Actinocrinis sp.]HEV2344513.1 hypothetical protein [Actinocrinis sp.]
MIIKRLGAIVGAAVAALTLASSASAATATPTMLTAPTGHTITWVSPDGKTKVSLHTMTASEVAAAGLTKYAPPTAKPISGSLVVGSSATAPTHRTAVTPNLVHPNASGCWSETITWNFAFGMAAYGSEDWCGDGTWVSYTSPSCWGTGGWYPTYNYMSCNVNSSYGVGWNLAQLTYHWDMCIAWVPVGGYCAEHAYPYAEYQAFGNGSFNLISYHS